MIATRATAGVRDQSRMTATIRVRHAIEFIRGYFIQSTQKPIASRSGRESAYIGLDNAGILRACRPNCYLLPAQQLHYSTWVRLVTQSIRITR